MSALVQLFTLFIGRDAFLILTFKFLLIITHSAFANSDGVCPNSALKHFLK